MTDMIVEEEILGIGKYIVWHDNIGKKCITYLPDIIVIKRHELGESAPDSEPG